MRSYPGAWGEALTGCGPKRPARQWPPCTPSGGGIRRADVLGVVLSAAALLAAPPRPRPRESARPPPSASASSPRSRTSPTAGPRCSATYWPASASASLPSGVDVGDLVIARDVDDLSQRIARGEVEFIIETAFPTLVLQERSRPPRPRPGRGAARAARRPGVCSSRRRTRPSAASPDLRGRTLVLQVLRSTSAFALPKAELDRAGLFTLVPADDARAGRSPRAVRPRPPPRSTRRCGCCTGRATRARSTRGTGPLCPRRSARSSASFSESQPIVRGLLVVPQRARPRGCVARPPRLSVSPPTTTSPRPGRARPGRRRDAVRAPDRRATARDLRSCLRC